MNGRMCSAVTISVNILQIVVRAMAGWHPALWWIDRRLQSNARSPVTR